MFMHILFVLGQVVPAFMMWFCFPVVFDKKYSEYDRPIGILGLAVFTAMMFLLTFIGVQEVGGEYSPITLNYLGMLAIPWKTIRIFREKNGEKRLRHWVGRQRAKLKSTDREVQARARAYLKNILKVVADYGQGAGEDWDLVRDHLREVVTETIPALCRRRRQLKSAIRNAKKVLNGKPIGIQSQQIDQRHRETEARLQAFRKKLQLTELQLLECLTYLEHASVDLHAALLENEALSAEAVWSSTLAFPELVAAAVASTRQGDRAANEEIERAVNGSDRLSQLRGSSHNEQHSKAQGEQEGSTE